MNQRLDAALAERGLARSRSHAHQLIAEGAVSLNGLNVTKPSTPVREDDELSVVAEHGYVSRAALKLVAALDEFAVNVEGAFALDAGASTGGFTQVLRERGARRVLAVDVGHGQLSPTIRLDDRVIVVEGENVRDLTANRVRDLTHGEELPTIVVADLSFISLELVIPALISSSAPNAEYVLLIKPQFEVGRNGVREGIVRDPVARADAVERVLWAAHDAGLNVAGLSRSPILGAHGNVEVVAWLSHRMGTSPTEWSDRIREVTA
ncbi:MAG: TlyA family RNA methyltransferase [Agromyces sp.]